MFLKFKTYLFLFFIFFASSAFANNLVISNVTLEDRNASANTMVVQFDISWDHSWRKSDGRHDAVWVFVKLYQNSTAPWVHGLLYTAGTNPTNTSPGTNSDVKIVIPSDKIGAFISRKTVGSGTFSSTKVRLTVDYGTSGLADTDTVTAKVFGIEMVYVPEGPFYAGDGDNPNADEVFRTAIYGSSTYGSSPFVSVFNSSGTFQWSNRLGGTGGGLGNAATSDTNNNIIVTGHVTGNADLNGDSDTTDSNETGNTGVYASSDVFISVFNSSGTFQWSERLGGTASDIGYAITTDANNNIIVMGQVTGNADLNGDADTADSNETGSSGVYASTDAFISVFNSSGTFQWSERLGGTASDIGYAITTDANNNIIVMGQVTGNADLNGDADTADSNETGSSGVYASTDAFISVFNSSGTFQWSERLGGTDTDAGSSVTTDANNNIIVMGQVTGNADLNGDADTADSNETGNSGVYASIDAFVSVFNSSGTFQWSRRLGGTASGDTGRSVTTNTNNNIITVGYVTGNADLNGDADTTDSNETGSSGVYASIDAFISVFNSSGTFQWSERLGGTVNDTGYSVTTDANNNIIVMGQVTGNADLNGDADTTDSNETGDSGVYASIDAFISVFNSSGTFQWSRRLGGTATDIGVSVTTDTNNNVIVKGHVIGNADLNGDAAVTTTYGFYSTSDDDSAVQITTSGAAVTVDTNGNDDIDTSSTTVTGLAGITGNTSWPNGYDDFYLMKYEITQGQYVDFLNTLTRVQQGTRVAATVSGNTIANYYVMSNGTTVASRQGIRAPASGNSTSPTTVVFGNDFNANGTFNETDDGQNIAMNYMNWTDLLAYADWAGLRPITEMEFEKANHGPSSVTYGEYAWGSTNITGVTSISNSGFGTEVAGQTGPGLTNYNNGGASGPLRVGFEATSATNRKSSGAGYYGNMGLSGNLIERVVTLGNSTGRAFTGTQGDGTLTSTASFEGNATNTDWPGINATTARGVTAATGSGSKGGGWNTTTLQYLTVSDRTTATTVDATRASDKGGRLGRTAP